MPTYNGKHSLPSTLHLRILSEILSIFNFALCYHKAHMEGLTHYDREVRPWGHFDRFTLNEKSTVKIITVNEGEEFSLQTHAHRDEFWYIVSGHGHLTHNDEKKDVEKGDHIFIKQGDTHRMKGGLGGVTILEIALGEFSESDIKRIEDDYGRA